jgi:glycyl-tRNA synthetase
VIEPSFGIGRILYHLLEHSFHVRPTAEAHPAPGGSSSAATPDTKILRAYLSLPPHMAPVKVALLPLSGQPQFVPLISRLQRLFTASNVSSKADSSGNSIGRRYARSDEVGIPFAVTVDFDSVKDNTVTLRERDSTQQVRLSVSEVVDVVTKLCRETAGGGEEEGDSEEEKAIQQRRHITWPQVYSTYPQIIRSEADDS